MFPNSPMKYRVTKYVREQITNKVLAGELEEATKLWVEAQLPYTKGTVINAEARNEMIESLTPRCREYVAALADALDATLRDKHKKWFEELQRNNSESHKEA